jgi:hypothetical protein
VRTCVSGVNFMHEVTHKLSHLINELAAGGISQRRNQNDQVYDDQRNNNIMCEANGEIMPQGRLDEVLTRSIHKHEISLDY